MDDTTSWTRLSRLLDVLQALAPVVAASDLERGGHLLQRALEIRRATLKPDDPAIAETLGSLGEYYRQRQDYVRAREAYRSGLEVWPTPASRRHPNAIMLLNDYGTFLNRMNEPAEAEALQREGLTLPGRSSATKRWPSQICSTTWR